jgi:twitching motility protein PilI
VDTKSETIGANWMLPFEALTRFVPQGNIINSLNENFNTEMVRYGYQVSGQGFLIGKGMKSEVVEDKTIYPIPKTGSLLLGMMNLRGNLIPVFTLGQALNLRNNKSSIVLVMGDSGNEVALTIDDYPKPVRELNDLSDLPSYPDNILPFMSPGTSYENMNWNELDCHAFFKGCANRQ